MSSDVDPSSLWTKIEHLGPEDIGKILERGLPAIQKSPTVGSQAVPPTPAVPSAQRAADVVVPEIAVNPETSIAELYTEIANFGRKSAEHEEHAYQEYGEQAKEVEKKELEAYGIRKGLVEKATPAMKAAAGRTIELPTLEPEPAVPSLAPRPFLSTDGKHAFQSLVAGIGQLVMAFAGMSSPVAALTALGGAMEGWAEGDVDRTTRLWKEYEAKVSKLNRDNERAIQTWQHAITQRADDLEAARVLLQTNLIEADLPAYAAQVAEHGLARSFQKFTMADNMTKQWMGQENRLLRDQLALMRYSQTEQGKQLTNYLNLLRIEAALQRPDQASMDFLVDQYLHGDQSVKQNIGRGIQGPAIMSQFINTLRKRATAAGMSPADVAATIAAFQGLKAGQRSLAVREASTLSAVTEAESLIPTMEASASEVPKTEWPIVNRVLRWWNLNIPTNEAHSAAWQKFEIAVNSFIPVYVRALKGTGVPDVTSSEHARSLLTTTQNVAQFRAALQQLQREMQIAQTAPGTVRDRIIKEFTKSKESAAPTPAPAPKKSRSLEELLKEYGH